MEEPKKRREVQLKKHREEIEVSLEVQEKLDEVKDKIPEFEIRKVNNNIAMLDRIKGANCRVCDRYHERENAMLIIGENVRIKCWRDDRISEII